MGYSYGSLLKLVDDKSLFVGKRVLTLGTLYPFLSARHQQRLAQRGFDFNVPKEEFSKHVFTGLLGAECCHSLDVSGYQGAEIICNLNVPILKRYAGNYDVVLDAGTLEHVSNLSTALENIFGLLRDRGIYYFGVPSNNWVDHGFFQFSPTFFRDLCIDNPSLELVRLCMGANETYYDYKAQNPAFLQALFSSRQRLNVVGIIRKNGEELNLDLTQSKYRKLHHAAGSSTVQTENGASDARASAPTPLLRRTAIAMVQRFSTSPWIPLSAKRIVLDMVYRFRRRSG